MNRACVASVLVVALLAGCSKAVPLDDFSGSFQIHNRTDEAFVVVALDLNNVADDHKFVPSGMDVHFPAARCVGTGAVLVDQQRRAAARLTRQLCGGEVWKLEPGGRMRLFKSGDATEQLGTITRPADREPYPSALPWTTPSPQPNAEITRRS